MSGKFLQVHGSFRLCAACLALLSLGLFLTYNWASAQAPATGPALRIDFAGSRPKPAPPAQAIPAGVTGPPLRIDFAGSRPKPAPPAQAIPTGVTGPPLRIDFAGSRPKPPAPRN